jgi:hypothetical protein
MGLSLITSLCPGVPRELLICGFGFNIPILNIKNVIANKSIVVIDHEIVLSIDNTDML